MARRWSRSREQQRTVKQPASPGQPTALAQARAFSDELDRRKRLGGVVDLDRGRVTLARRLFKKPHE